MSETDPASDRPRSRLEDEVLEILHRAEQPTSFNDRVQRAAWRYRGTLRRSRRRVPSVASVGPGLYLIGSLALALIGASLRGGSPLLATLCGLASVALLVLLWLPGSRGRAGGTKRWRGRDLDLTSGRPEWLDDLRDRFRKPPGR